MRVTWNMALQMKKKFEGLGDIKSQSMSEQNQSQQREIRIGSKTQPTHLLRRFGRTMYSRTSSFALDLVFHCGLLASRAGSYLLGAQNLRAERRPMSPTSSATSTSISVWLRARSDRNGAGGRGRADQRPPARPRDRWWRGGSPG